MPGVCALQQGLFPRGLSQGGKQGLPPGSPLSDPRQRPLERHLGLIGDAGPGVTSALGATSGVG